MGTEVYPVSRTTLREFLAGVIRDAVIYTVYAKRKTVSAMDIVYALKKRGRTIYGIGECDRPARPAPARPESPSVIFLGQ